jgi:hypothetical protein
VKVAANRWLRDGGRRTEHIQLVDASATRKYLSVEQRVGSVLESL